MLGWAAGTFGALIDTTDGGVTWKPQATRTTAHLFALAFVDGKTGIAVGSRGTLLVTNNGGGDWKPHQGFGNLLLTGVSFVSAKRAVVVGYQGAILQTDDGGVTWQKLDALVTTDLLSVFFTDELHGWAAGDSGVVLTTGDGGTIWLPVNVRTFPKLNTVFLPMSQLDGRPAPTWWCCTDDSGLSGAGSLKAAVKTSLIFSFWITPTAGRSARAAKYFYQFRGKPGPCVPQELSTGSTRSSL